MRLSTDKIRNMAGLSIAFTLLAAAAPAHALVSQTSFDYSQYKALGIITKTDPNGKAIQYHYDLVNRLDKLVLPGNVVYDYEYDLTDQLIQAVHPNGKQEFGYDDLDRPISLDTYFGATRTNLLFAYDHQDRLTWITYPNNGRVCYQYDPDGRLTRVGRVLPGQTASYCRDAQEQTDYHYDSRGRLERVTYPNAIERHIAYTRTKGSEPFTGTSYGDRMHYL